MSDTKKERFRLWLHKWLPLIGPTMVGIGGLGIKMPQVIAVSNWIGLPPSIPLTLATLIGICGAIGTWMANIPLPIKQALPWFFPVTPEMHEAAKSRLVSLPPSLPAGEAPAA